MPNKATISYLLEAAQASQVFVNEFICKLLSELDGNSSDFNAGTDMFFDKTCSDGKKHTIYCVPERILRPIWLGKDRLHISIRIWQQRGNGPIREITGNPLFPRKKRTSKNVRK